VSTIVAAFSQFLLKRSANKSNGKGGFLQKFMNPRVIIGYGMLFVSLALNSIALRGVDLGALPGITALGFIWILLIAIFLLKEKPSKYRVLGTFIIFIGVIVSKL